MTYSSESSPDQPHFIETDIMQTAEEKIRLLQDTANFIRRDGFQMVLAAGSGHLGGSSSSAELLTALYFGGQFNFDPQDSKNPSRDRVLIRGHEGPVRYPIFSLIGYIQREELMRYRSYGSRLPGHEDMHLTPGVDITPSGSLGMLLSYGVGAATEIKNEGGKGRVVVFLGDGEEQEGNVGEAARHAATLPIDNLICILDKNRKQLSRETGYADGKSDVSSIWQGYGWDVIEISDGHDIGEILSAYEKLQSITKPTFVIANTIKGRGIEGAEGHFNGFHTLSSVHDPKLVYTAVEKLNTSLAENGAEERVPALAPQLVIPPSEIGKVALNRVLKLDIAPISGSLDNLDYAQFEYFKKFRSVLEANPDVPLYVLTPDFLRSDMVDLSKFEEYAHYYDTGLREQHTIAMAHGISVTNPNARIFINYGDAFLYRALDQINAAAQGDSSMLIVGEYSGISQAQNGRTHQSNGQPGAVMQIPELDFFEPADVRDLYNVFNHALGKNEKLTYVRVHPLNMPMLSRENEDMYNIDSYTTHNPERRPDLIMVASGFVVASAVEAAKMIELEHGQSARVINAVNPKCLGDEFVDKLEAGVPLLTIYNGRADALGNQVGGAILRSGRNIPSRVVSHGFESGITGKIIDLQKHFGLDPKGIALQAMRTISRQ